MITGKEYRLRRQRAAIRLNPFPASAVNRAMPQTNPLISTQGGVGYFQHDAARLFR
jgi:hypothetical protein